MTRCLGLRQVRSQMATARLEDAVNVRTAWEQARNRVRADYLRLFGTDCQAETLSAAQGRLEAAELQLAEAWRLERQAWECWE